jgi:hypothetical protein
VANSWLVALPDNWILGGFHFSGNGVYQEYALTTRNCAILSSARTMAELSFYMGRDRKVRYVSKDEVAQGIRKQFSPEYAEFLLVQMGYSPQVCPKCGNGSFTTLWLAKPNNAINGKMWAKWYFWCDKCFSGIRCPLGTWWISRTTPYILHGDEKALTAALPENLKLIPQKLVPQK